MCDGTKNAGPKVEGCSETNITIEMMKSSCHGDYYCQVQIEEQPQLFMDPGCVKPKKEVKVEFTCGKLDSSLVLTFDDDL